MQSSAIELRQVHETRIMGILGGSIPIDFSRAGVADLFVQAVSEQPEFQKDMFRSSVSKEKLSLEVRRNIADFMIRSGTAQNKRIDIPMISANTVEDEWRIYLTNMGKNEQVLPDGHARIDIILETRLYRELGLADNFDKWNEERERIRARVQEIRSKMTAFILDSPDPSPWL